MVVYRQVWQSLEDMNKDEAMSQFVHCLSVACPQFTKHIEALQQHRNELLSKQWVFPPLLSLSHICESVCVGVQVILCVTFLRQVEHGLPRSPPVPMRHSKSVCFMSALHPYKQRV